MRQTSREWEFNPKQWSGPSFADLSQQAGRAHRVKGLSMAKLSPFTMDYGPLTGCAVGNQYCIKTVPLDHYICHMLLHSWHLNS